MSQEQLVHKVTLSTNKVVLLREMKIKYQEMAMRAVGNKAGDNTVLMGSMVQKEILKQLIVQIDGKEPAKISLEKLDDVFTYQEYMQLNAFMQKIMGGADAGELQSEIVAIG